MRAPEPMYATIGTAVPEGSDWVFEEKYDGMRVVALVTSRAVHLVTRNARDKREQCPEIVEAFHALAKHAKRPFIVGGFTEPRLSRAFLGALLLGYFDRAGKLRYVGNMGGGFNRASLKDMLERLQPLERRTSPFLDRAHDVHKERESVQQWAQEIR